MTRMRIKFYKLDEVRYISHLDLMRAFSRAMRRAKVPIALSQGYNPHHLISMGSALAVGLTSTGEYMDLEFAEAISVEKFMEMMKPQLPKGLEIAKGEIIPKEVASLMAQINLAVYLVRLKTNQDKGGMEKLISDFLNQEEIVIERRRKKKIRQVDLKPMIRDLQVLEMNGDLILKIKVQTGSRGNVRPEELMAAIAEYTEGFEEVPLTWMHRQDLYVEKDDKLLTPFEVSII